jgi:hypothetical protein
MWVTQQARNLMMNLEDHAISIILTTRRILSGAPRHMQALDETVRALAMRLGGTRHNGGPRQ